VVFVGDRGMVSDENIETLEGDGQGYLVGMKRRRNAELDGWLQKVDDKKWLDCPVGITAREKKENPPRTRVQEIDMGEDKRRVFVIDSDERRAYEQAKRMQAMERVRVKLASVQRRVANGTLTDAARIGAAAERALRDHKGYRYYAWTLRDGVFAFCEDPLQFDREKRLEGRYVISTSEKDLTALDAVAMYKQLAQVERGFRRMKDVLSLRPVYHQVEPRVRAHVFVAALGLLLQTLLQHRMDKAEVGLSAEHALQALETVRYVRFRIDDDARTGVSAANPRARQVLKALGITNVRPPAPPEGEPTVM
jgi:transposase